MKNITKYTITTIGLSILFMGVLFLFKPNYWFKIINPIHYEVVSIDTKIINKKLDLNIGVILNSDYFLDVILDSLSYDIKMDSTKFSYGKKSFASKYDFDTDTLFFPLTIDLDTIRNIIKTASEDSLILEIDLKNYIRLPFTGQSILPINITKKIPTPNPPKINVLSVEKKLLKLKDAIYEINFEIINPNHYEINIQELNAVLKYPDLFIGKIECNAPIKVAPYSSAIAKSEINIDSLNLIKDGLRIIMQPKKEWEYTLEAQLIILKSDSTLMPISISNEGEMPLLKRNK